MDESAGADAQRLAPGGLIVAAGDHHDADRSVAEDLLGCQVDVYERSVAELESRGVGIVVLEATSRYFRERTSLALDELTTATDWLRYLDRDGSVSFQRRLPYRYSAWHTIYRALLGCLEERGGAYHLGQEMRGFAQHGDHVEVRFADGAAATCDLLVCADGIASTARAALQPQARPASG